MVRSTLQHSGELAHRSPEGSPAASWYCAEGRLYRVSLAAEGSGSRRVTITAEPRIDRTEESVMVRYPPREAVASDEMGLRGPAVLLWDCYGRSCPFHPIASDADTHVPPSTRA
jgi:hypothetical protein